MYHLLEMKTTTPSLLRGALDRMLDPLNDCLTPALARRLARLRANSATRARVDELATKCSEGELTAVERGEYEAYVRAIHLVSVLQSKARTFLAKRRPSR